MSRATWWSVHLELAAPSARARIDPSDERLDLLAELLARHDGVVSSSKRSLSLRCSVTNERYDGALGKGSEIIQKALVEAGLLDWPVVRVEAVRQDRLKAELYEPPVPEVLGVAEVAKLLGVTRQRLAVIRREHEDFPRPFTELAATPLWYREAIEEWRKNWDRRPGPRPIGLAVAGIGPALLSGVGEDASQMLMRRVLLGTGIAALFVLATWLLRGRDTATAKNSVKDASVSTTQVPEHSVEDLAVVLRRVFLSPVGFFSRPLLPGSLHSRLKREAVVVSHKLIAHEGKEAARLGSSLLSSCTS